MLYTAELTDREIKENHKHFNARASLYREKGLDFIESRKFILAQAHPLQGSILEIGSGIGYTTLALAKAGYKFISIDKDMETLKIAALNLAYEKVLSNVKFQLMDGKSLTFSSGSFNNIVTVNLFHHVSDVEKILYEADRVLCAGGKIVLADFNENGMEIVNSVHKQEERMHEDYGVSKERVIYYLHSLGYETKNCEDKCHWVLIAEKKMVKRKTDKEQK